MQSKKVKQIGATDLKKELTLEQRKLRVAAYCRVSNHTEEQLASLNRQIQYYTSLIAQNSNWIFVKIYSDVGSGIRIGNRPGYQQMIKDSKRHRFDLVLVKSLSRFGRNVLNTLKQIRRWKQMGITLYSEAENIDTNITPETFLVLWLAHMQEESHIKSENIKFGIQQRMRCGKVILNHTQFLGYTKGSDGILKIFPEAAAIVRKIFDLYLEGNGVRKIKKYLDTHHIKTATGQATWSTSTIDRMLSNEKYIGIVVMQKTYTADYLTGKQMKNNGQKSRFVVENAHEAIVDAETFMKVQKKKGHIH